MVMGLAVSIPSTVVMPAAWEKAGAVSTPPVSIVVEPLAWLKVEEVPKVPAGATRVRPELWV